MGNLPHGWSTWDRASICGGYDRANWLIENEEEIQHAFADGLDLVECGYCGFRCSFNQRGSRTSAGVIRWFHAHACPPLEASEAAGVLYDLGVLPEGSPFAIAA